MIASFFVSFLSFKVYYLDPRSVNELSPFLTLTAYLLEEEMMERTVKCVCTMQ